MMGRQVRAAQRVALLLVGLSVAWLAGFGWFASMIDQPDGPAPAMADGIVVLTGGADRVATAFHLLAGDRARQLLISGVARRAELADLAHQAGMDTTALADRTTVGHAATSTRGNAEETGAWARAHDIHSLIVVTAAYHMPRALIELSRVLPDVSLYPVRVKPAALRDGSPLAVLRLLAGEYTKWLAAASGLSRLQAGLPAEAEMV
jgi:uncharacterized SAM-binding protein YcdF (DUF218 family)